jgi:hypothetical protein
LVAASLAGSVALLAGAAPAAAYVRNLTAASAEYYWETSCVHVSTYPQGLADLTLDQINAAALASAAAWSKQDPDLAPCTYLDLRMRVAAPTAGPPAAANDRINNVIFRDTSWCPAGATSGDDCYDSMALALTAVTTVTKTGQIVDADIEVNAVNFLWADIGANPDAFGKHDLQNALTHEMGHFIGLEHTCYEPSSGRLRPTDHTGAPVPDCSTASQEVRDTTMYTQAATGDVTKRTLAPDEKLAVCEIYPLDRDPSTCPPPGSGGGDDGFCSIAPAGAGVAGSGWTAVLLAAAAAVARQRSRSSRRSRTEGSPGIDAAGTSTARSRSR